MTCLKCGSTTKHKSGTSKRNGKPWSGSFCENDNCKDVQWDTDTTSVARKVFGATEVHLNQAPQTAPTIPLAIGVSLDRLVAHTERMAIALERLVEYRVDDLSQAVNKGNKDNVPF